MPNPIFAIAGSGALSTVAGVVGANKAAKGQRKAADAQVEATEKQIAFSKEVFNAQREDTKPWREAGVAALNKLQAGIADGSFSMADFNFTMDPGYQFRLSEGQRALDRSAAAGGSLFSGEQLKRAQAWGQSFASDEFGRAWDRAVAEKNRRYNYLAGVAGTGQAANSEIGRAGSELASRVTGAYQQQGNALATAAANQGQIAHNMYGTIAGAGNQAIGNWLTYKMLGAG